MPGLPADINQARLRKTPGGFLRELPGITRVTERGKITLRLNNAEGRGESEMSAATRATEAETTMTGLYIR